MNIDIDKNKLLQTCQKQWKSEQLRAISQNSPCHYTKKRLDLAVSVGFLGHYYTDSWSNCL